MAILAATPFPLLTGLVFIGLTAVFSVGALVFFFRKKV